MVSSASVQWSDVRSAVEGADDAERSAVDDVGVDHGGSHVAVAEWAVSPVLGDGDSSWRRELLADLGTRL